jgi:hypothetical protein
LSLTCIFLSRADTGVLNLAPLKHEALGVRNWQPEPHLFPPYAEPLAEQAESGHVVATEVVDSSTRLEREVALSIKI